MAKLGAVISNKGIFFTTAQENMGAALCQLFVAVGALWLMTRQRLNFAWASVKRVPGSVQQGRVCDQLELYWRLRPRSIFTLLATLT